MWNGTWIASSKILKHVMWWKHVPWEWLLQHIQGMYKWIKWIKARPTCHVYTACVLAWFDRISPVGAVPCLGEPLLWWRLATFLSWGWLLRYGAGPLQMTSPSPRSGRTTPMEATCRLLSCWWIFTANACRQTQCQRVWFSRATTLSKNPKMA